MHLATVCCVPLSLLFEQRSSFLSRRESPRQAGGSRPLLSPVATVDGNGLNRKEEVTPSRLAP
jgi:hypothetical protein